MENTLKLTKTMEIKRKRKEKIKKRIAKSKRKKIKKTTEQTNPRQERPKRKSLAFVSFCK